MRNTEENSGANMVDNTSTNMLPTFHPLPNLMQGGYTVFCLVSIKMHQLHENYILIGQFRNFILCLHYEHYGCIRVSIH
jgi:hypothetical protein